MFDQDSLDDPAAICLSRRLIRAEGGIEKRQARVAELETEVSVLKAPSTGFGFRQFDVVGAALVSESESEILVYPKRSSEWILLSDVEVSGFQRASDEIRVDDENSGYFFRSLVDAMTSWGGAQRSEHE
jgi:hypothetical protein